MTGSVPDIRICRANEKPVRNDGDFVLYWMTAFRRPFYNFALQRAVHWAEKLQRPLVILEALRCDYTWASDRLHRFILEGMADNARHFTSEPVLYYPYVEPAPGKGKGLLAALAHSACLVIADDFPAFFLPRMVAAAAAKVDTLLEKVDSNGLLPLRAAGSDYPTAYAFRRFLQKELRAHLMEFPASNPLQKAQIPTMSKLPAAIPSRWPVADKKLLAANQDALARLPIDHQILPAEDRGGYRTAGEKLKRFLEKRLALYAEQRSEPQKRVTSELSPYLHFGHISAHEIVRQLTDRKGWSIGDLSPEARGKRRGWWGMGEPEEAFLDQLVTWRELSFNFCAFRNDYDRYKSLPPWAVETLEKHRGDPRPYLYTLETFEKARTHDPLWNAAQTQLVREGRMQNYLRMLWGKKIFEWSPDAEEALKVMVELNNRYALDGRDPNSFSGIFWCLGRYDRPWGPERPIFGKIRYMSSENTARKYKVKEYIEKYSTPCTSRN